MRFGCYRLCFCTNLWHFLMKLPMFSGIRGVFFPIHNSYCCFPKFILFPSVRFVFLYVVIDFVYLNCFCVVFVLLCCCYVWQLCCWACSLIKAYGMDGILSYLPIFTITATCTLGIGQPYTTGDHSYKTEVAVDCHFGWRGTVHRKKNVPEFKVILPQPHNIVSFQLWHTSASRYSTKFVRTGLCLLGKSNSVYLGGGDLMVSIVLLCCRLQVSEPKHKLRPAACTF